MQRQRNVASFQPISPDETWVVDSRCLWPQPTRSISLNLRQFCIFFAEICVNILNVHHFNKCSSWVTKSCSTRAAHDSLAHLQRRIQYEWFYLYICGPFFGVKKISPFAYVFFCLACVQLPWISANSALPIVSLAVSHRTLIELRAHEANESRIWKWHFKWPACYTGNARSLSFTLQFREATCVRPITRKTLQRPHKIQIQVRK